MPPTLLSTYHDAPQFSTELKMPHVFVVPPEEDETPTWCCFNANEPASTPGASPDTNFLQDALDMLQVEPDAPWYHRDSGGPFAFQGSTVLPKKNGETRSIMDFLMNDDYLESDEETEMEMEPEEEPYLETIGNTSNVNDPDVVEVLKIERYSDDIEQPSHAPTPPVKSKSFKSRASKALRTLVGKGSLRSKTKTQPIPSPVNEVEPPLKSKTPLPRGVSRRGSAIFTQIFSPPSQPQPSVSSFNAAHASSNSPPSNVPRYPSSLHNVPPPDTRQSTPGSPTSLNFDSHDVRSPSPTSSTQTTSNRPRFSMMKLSRVFSLPSSDEAPHTTSMSRNSSEPSTSSFSGPETPTDESAPVPNCRQNRPFAAVPALDPGDVSFEMKLDSLHFDSLSFDADRF
ncbi:hypothetical protein C0991_010945 [Blastosporella zonata]|nr:hypothetical protein C0991_010945 [Blastosporella zonata]